jgi:hypothetical protein
LLGELERRTRPGSWDELALELGHTAELLQTLVSGRRGSAAAKLRQETAPEAAA